MPLIRTFVSVLLSFPRGIGWASGHRQYELVLVLDGERIGRVLNFAVASERRCDFAVQRIGIRVMLQILKRSDA